MANTRSNMHADLELAFAGKRWYHKISIKKRPLTVLHLRWSLNTLSSKFGLQNSFDQSGLVNVCHFYVFINIKSPVSPYIYVVFSWSVTNPFRRTWLYVFLQACQQIPLYFSLLFRNDKSNLQIGENIPYPYYIFFFWIIRVVLSHLPDQSELLFCFWAICHSGIIESHS